MDSLTYYHVTGRPPTARTDITDRNMIFFLEHQLHWDRPRIVQFMQGLPANTNEPAQPWGSQFMNLHEPQPQQQEQQQPGNDGPPDQPDIDQNQPDDFAGGDDDDNFVPPAAAPPPPPPPSDDDDDSDDEEDDGAEAPRRAPRRHRGEPRGPVRRSRRINQRASKKRAIEKMRTKRSGLLYKLLFGR